MDASEQPTEVQPQSAPPAKAGLPLRVLGALGALILAFAAAVAIISMLDISSLTPCHDANRDPNFNDNECFDGSSKRKLLTLALGFPGALLAAIAVLLMLAFVVRGRGIKQVGFAVAAGAILFGISLLVGSTG